VLVTRHAAQTCAYRHSASSEVLTAVLSYSSRRTVHQFAKDHSAFILRVKQFLTSGKRASSAHTNFWLSLRHILRQSWESVAIRRLPVPHLGDYERLGQTCGTQLWQTSCQRTDADISDVLLRLNIFNFATHTHMCVCYHCRPWQC